MWSAAEEQAVSMECLTGSVQKLVYLAKQLISSEFNADKFLNQLDLAEIKTSFEASYWSSYTNLGILLKNAVSFITFY